MFEIYTKEVEIDTLMGKEKIKLRPLNGRHFPKLMSVMTKLQSDGSEDAKSTLLRIDEATSANLHYLILETLKKSYPNEDVEKLDEFTTQNMFALITPIFELNINNKVTE